MVSNLPEDLNFSAMLVVCGTYLVKYITNYP